MFCRLGSEEDSRPVAATAWWYEVWMRPVRGCTCAASASVYVPRSFASPRNSRISFGSACSAASSSRTSSAVEGWPVGVRRTTGMPSRSNRICCSCFGDSRLNGPPAAMCASRSSSPRRRVNSVPSARRNTGSTSTPVRSMRASTGCSGCSSVSYRRASAGIASSRGLSTWCRRSVTSASSAAYGPAVSTGTWLNESCFAPLPATSSNVIVLMPR